MNLQTKYDIGQEVFVEFGKELLPATIKDIVVTVTKDSGTGVVYGVYMCNGISGSGEQYIHNSIAEYNQVLDVRKDNKIKELQAKIAKLQGE